MTDQNTIFKKNNIAKSLVIVALGVGFLSGCSNKYSDPADVEYDVGQSPYHKVKRNETLASIAQRYNMDKRELARLNGIKAPYRIIVGQKLIVKTLASKKTKGDGFDMPASEGALQTTGEITVNKLAPLPGTQEESGAAQDPNQNGSEQPFSSPAGMSSSDEGMHTDSEKGSPDDGKTANGLPGTPKSASFYSWPVKGKIIKNFESGKKGQTGIKISAPMGTPVTASNNGVVARAQQIQGYGKLVLVKHDNGFVSIYAHMDSIAVKRGDVVSAGQKIGTVGKSGNVREPQLHFEIREKQGKVPVDPTKFLD